MARDNLPVVLLGLGGIAGLWYWSRMRSGGGVTLPAGGGNPTGGPNYYSTSPSNMVDPDAIPAPIHDELTPTEIDASTAVMATLPTPVVPMPSTVVDASQPLGIRLNNPGNIRKGTTWQGMAADQSGSPYYITFTSPQYGIRAMTRILRQYASRGLQTIAQIIGTWAPPSENKTVPYITHVSQLMRVAPNVPLSEAQFPSLIAAIITHENGRQPYAPALIAQGIALERST